MGTLARLCPPLIMVGLVLGMAACATEPQDLLDSGNRHFAAGRFSEASIEFRRLLQSDPDHGIAHFRLAETHIKLQNLDDAAVEFVVAAQLMPDHLEAQLGAGDMLLLAGKFVETQVFARRAMQIDPKNIRALVINAKALAGLRRHGEAMAAIERAMQLDPTRAQTVGDLGALQMTTASVEESEASFRRMIELDPRAVDARLTLASFYWVQGRTLEAEAELNKALELDPKHVAVNRAMATFYLGTQRPRAAEDYLVAAVDGMGTTAARLTLADYYLSLGRSSDAERVLLQIVKRPDGFGEARSRLAAIAYDAGRTKEAHTLLDDTLRSDRSNPRTLLTKAGFLLAENNPDRAFELATAAAAADPNAVAPRYMLASIHRSRRDLVAAERMYREILQVNPRSVAAQLELSNLEMSRGSYANATTAAEVATRALPDNIESRTTLLRSLIATGDLDRAESVVRPLLKDFGDRGIVQWMAGMLQLARGNRVAARTHFERSLVIQPGTVEPLDALNALDIDAGRIPSARARVDAQLAINPRSVALLMLAARVYSVASDRPAAERALKTALEIDPGEPAIYDELARLYASQKQLDRAVREFEALAKANPTSVGPPTLLGVILTALDRPFEAQAWFEKGMKVDPRNAVIANNLAWLYADQGGDLDAALKLALLAKEQIHDRPEVDDTLGWIYYKRDEIGRALPILKSTVERAPGNRIFQYHLGLAHARAGNRNEAREALQKALRGNVTFPGASNAKAVLGTLQ